MKTSENTIQPLAGLLAWLFPGCGHIYLGQRRRGFLIMVGVLFMFFTGLLIGGIDAVDRVEDRLWFLAQVWNGPIALAADLTNQNWLQVEASQSDEFRVRVKGVARTNEFGILFIALGGLMNFVVILDALQGGRLASEDKNRHRRRTDDHATPTHPKSTDSDREHEEFDT